MVVNSKPVGLRIQRNALDTIGEWRILGGKFFEETQNLIVSFHLDSSVLVLDFGTSIILGFCFAFPSFEPNGMLVRSRADRINFMLE